MRKSVLRIAAASIAFVAIPANAAPVITFVGANFATTPLSFTVGSSIFTFSGTGDIFNPTAISTGGTGQVNTIFGSPTTNFTNRGVVTFGPNDQYGAFPSPTTIRFSNGENFIGLRAMNGGNVFYGFAFTTNNILNSYGFENVPGRAITATTAVPEPTTWAMIIGGFGFVGGAMRRRRTTQLRFAA